MSKPLICVECGSANADLTDGTEIYPHRPDLAHKSFWRCECGAYVSCHQDTTKPLGRPAKAQTHRARQQAHAVFDPLWQAKARRDGCAKHVARGAGYKWLAAAMAIKPKDCHIGHFTQAQCGQAIAIINDFHRSKGSDQ